MKAVSPYSNVQPTRAFCSLGLCTLLLSIWVTHASAEMMLIDDFNDFNDDGWTRVDSTDGQTWGPAIIDVNGKGEYRFESGGPLGFNVPGGGFMTSIWDESSDPQYSEGYFRTRIRIGENFTTAGLGMRFTGSLESGFNGYLFRIATDDEPFESDPRDNPPGSMSIELAANSEILDDVKIDFPFVVDEELMLEAGAVGNQLSMKVWRVGEDEPAEPQLVWEESTYSTGQFLVEANATGRILISRASAVFDDIVFTPVSVGDGGGTSLTTPEPSGLAAMLIGTSCLVLVTRRRSGERGAPQLRLAASARHALKQSVLSCGGLLLVLVVSSIGRAQVLFELGTFSVDDDATTGVIPLEVPAGTYNSYRLTTDWSAIFFNPFSREAIWSIADGPLSGATTTYYANPGSAPNSAPNNNPVTLEWDGFLDLPMTGPLDLSFFNLETFGRSRAEWANTVLELSFQAPEPPPELDANLGVVAAGFSPFNLVTSGNFDTELAVYSSTGAMLRRNDDAPGPEVYSQIDFDIGLPLGDYVAAIGGFNTTFEDGYQISPGSAGGDYGLDVAGSQSGGTLAAGQLAYVGFSVGTIPLLAGDYNDDGTVSAADYTVWRDHLGAAAGTLPNDTDGGVIGPAQYDTWKANFGMTMTARSANGSAVPEPSSRLVVVGLSLIAPRSLRSVRGANNDNSR